MSTSPSLVDRIEAEFAVAQAQQQQFMTEQTQQFEARQGRLQAFEATVEQLPEIWQPRLEALAKKFGENVSVQPHVEPGQRSAVLRFKTELAHISLRFTVAPDPDVRNVVVMCDLEILPIMMEFEKHSEISLPIDNVDKAALAQWLDDRIVAFVKTYLSLHQNQFYLRDHMVEDPIAKVKFPKYAAGAKLHQGKTTYYFLNESTCREFQERQSSHVKE